MEPKGTAAVSAIRNAMEYTRECAGAGADSVMVSGRVTAAADDSATTGTKVAAGAGCSTAASCGSSCRSEEHTSELQSLMRISYAVFCLKKKKKEEITK